MAENYLIIFTDLEDGAPSTHVRGLHATSDLEVTTAERILTMLYAPLHLRTILIPGDPSRNLFKPLSSLRDEEAERALR